MADQTNTWRRRSTSAIFYSTKHVFNWHKKEMRGRGRRRRRRKTITMEAETTDIEHDTVTGILQTAWASLVQV